MYRYQEFPRVVYGPDDATMVINSEAERPDGWANHPDDVRDTAAIERAAAETAAKDAEKALRAGYRDFLDEYGVVYAKNLPTPKLAELVDQLKVHLAEKGLADDGDGA